MISQVFNDFFSTFRFAASALRGAGLYQDPFLTYAAAGNPDRYHLQVRLRAIESFGFL